MLRLNRLLAALALAVLVATLSILGWLRQHTRAQVESSVTATVASFKEWELLHGPGGDSMLRFRETERLVREARRSPYIRDAVVTRLTAGGELPVVPFDLVAREGADWGASLAGLRREPLGDPARPFGFIYLRMNLAELRSLNMVLVATGIAVALMLTALLARLWLQESSLTRTAVELNERRRELIRVERLALAGQLAAGLLHDLRKPVVHIKNSLDDLTAALGDFASAATVLHELRHQTSLFFQILNDSQMERFVRSDRVGDEFVDLRPVLDQALSLVRYERGAVEVIRREADELPLVQAQPFRLVQLFSNLILNAYQALGGRGELTIEAEAVAGAAVEVRFRDNGPGIAEEHLERLFAPFFTTKPEGEGTGLGLMICKMIVEELGGRIEVETQAGGPTTFTVRLPAD